MKTRKFILIQIIVGLTFVSSMLFAQSNNQAYVIPFASEGNSVELSVHNSSSQSVSDVKIVALKVPTWLNFTQSNQEIRQIKPNREVSSTFTFSVDKSAPVNKEQSLSFVITTQSGEKWTKEIKISVAQPERFELSQNFPNPFNPATKIEYTLPKQATVKLTVYDVLGQEVQILVNQEQDAGYKSIVFDASNLPSGVYFYKLQAGSFAHIKKMMLLK